jgi:hypothetical protein
MADTVDDITKGCFGGLLIIFTTCTFLASVVSLGLSIIA